MTDTDDPTDALAVPGTDMPDAADPADPADHVAPTGRRTTAVAFGLAIGFAVLAAVLAVLLASDGDRSDEDLRAAAGRFGETLVSYDYRDPEAHRDAVLAMATGTFREEYESAFERGLGKVISQVKAVSQGYVKDVYLSAVDGGQAQAIVVVDIEHEGSSGANTLYDVYFRLTLLELDGEWLVDDVTDLSFGTAGAPAGGSTTSTTASASTTLP